MSYVEPSTRAAGYLVTAANWNQDVVANVSFLANPPKCKLRHSSDIDIPASGSVVLGVTAGTTTVFNTEIFDTDNMHSTSTNLGYISVNTAGTYLVGFHVRWSGGSTAGQRVLRIDRQTTLLGLNTVTASTDTTDQSLAVLSTASTSDFFRAVVAQNGSTAVDITAGDEFSPVFWAIWKSL